MPFTSPQMEKSRGVKSGEQESKGWVPTFQSNNQETPCPERHKHNGRSEGHDAEVS